MSMNQSGGFSDASEQPRYATDQYGQRVEQSGPYGGLFDIDWFGKINDGIKGATEQQIEIFISNLADRAAKCPDELKAKLRDALGIK